MVGGFPKRNIPATPPVESLPPTVPAEDIEYDEDGKRIIKEPLRPAARPEVKLPPPAPAPRPQPLPPRIDFSTNIRPTRPTKPTEARQREDAARAAQQKPAPPSAPATKTYSKPPQPFHRPIPHENFFGRDEHGRPVPGLTPDDIPF